MACSRLNVAFFFAHVIRRHSDVKTCSMVTEYRQAAVHLRVRGGGNMTLLLDMFGFNQYDTSTNCDVPSWVTLDILLETYRLAFKHNLIDLSFFLINIYLQHVPLHGTKVNSQLLARYKTENNQCPTGKN